ncbi:hypothetical protein [Neobacillus endophyticus]|uniref:hypothetical protein n=1 Tax=Neobacillus endophyticus TaxID=2738405 RepID=UPI001C260666|nr:hypothetical protein [Neobacillus endophyticus]
MSSRKAVFFGELRLCLRPAGNARVFVKSGSGIGGGSLMDMEQEDIQRSLPGTTSI